MTPKELLEEIKMKASQHGSDDDPDHEVGDLQEVVGIALAIMPDKSIPAFERALKEHFAATWYDQY